MAFLDEFDRADGPIGAPWSVDVGSFAVTSSEAAYTGAYTYPVDTEWSDFPTHIERTATVDVGSANMVCEWDFSRNSTLYMACVFRYVSSGHMLRLAGSITDPDLMMLHKIDAVGGNVLLWSGYVTGWQTHRIRIVADGTSITCWTNDVWRFAVTSSAYQTATRAGIGVVGVGWMPDSFSDSFSGSSLGGSWDVVGGSRWNVGGGVATADVHPSDAGFAGAALVDVGSPQQVVEWVLSGVTGPKNGIYLVFRAVNGGNYWFVTGSSLGPNHIGVYRRAGDTNTLMSSWVTSTAWGTGQTIRVEAGPSNVVVKINGTTVITIPAGTSDPWPRVGIGGWFSPSVGNLPSAQFASIDATAAVSNFQVLSASSHGVGPWGGVGRWSRFWCSPIRRPRTSVGILVAYARSAGVSSS